MYLMSDLVEAEYIKFDLRLIPQCIIDQYNLNDIAENGSVYAKINKAWFGLKQSGKIAHDDLVEHLAKHGYIQAKNTDGLFVHGLHDISFTLVVDDFGIMYKNKEDADHLISIMRGKYKFKVDFDAKQYIGIHIKWNYSERTVRCSMRGYVQQALEDLKHIFTGKHHYAPSKIDRPDYGAKIQFSKDDTVPRLSLSPKLNILNELLENSFTMHAPSTTQCYTHSTTSHHPKTKVPKPRGKL